MMFLPRNLELFDGQERNYKPSSGLNYCRFYIGILVNCFLNQKGLNGKSAVFFILPS